MYWGKCPYVEWLPGITVETDRLDDCGHLTAVLPLPDHRAPLSLATLPQWLSWTSNNVSNLWDLQACPSNESAWLFRGPVHQGKVGTMLECHLLITPAFSSYPSKVWFSIQWWLVYPPQESGTWPGLGIFGVSLSRTQGSPPLLLLQPLLMLPCFLPFFPSSTLKLTLSVRSVESITLGSSQLLENVRGHR